jgi:replication-associated recombination protein RarA
MKLTDLLLWEKYRPQSLKQMILIPRIAKLIENGVESNMIFYGTSGTGKTSLAKVLSKEYNSLNLNGKLGIDVLSDKIKKHFESLNFDHKDSVKLIFIDEFDNASRQLQDGLKSFIEEYPTARFIFTTNHIDKISDELRSRFLCVPFDSVNSEEREFLFHKQVNYVRAIVKREGSELYQDKEVFENIVRKNYPDLRASIVLAEVVLITGDVSVANTEYGSTNEELYKFIMDGNLNPVVNYDYVMNNFFITFDDAFKFLSRPFFEYLKEYHIQTIMDKGALILKKQKEYNETLNDTLDPLVHLVNYIIDLKTVITQ